MHWPLAFRDWSLNILEWNSILGETRCVLHGWPVLMWLAVTLTFPFLSQLILERREV